MTALSPRREGVLLDDHPMWRETLAVLCEGVGIDVIGSCSTSEEVVEVLDERAPDILIVDLRLAGAETSLGCIREARDRFPSLRILVISGFDDPATIDEALAAGADAFISKAAAAEDIAYAVRQVFNQSFFIGPWHRQSDGEAPRVNQSSGQAELTKRETEILELVSEGYSNSRVARMLWVTEQTVKFHLSNIYRKLRVGNRTEATRWWVSQGTNREDKPAEDKAAKTASRSK